MNVTLSSLFSEAQFFFWNKHDDAGRLTTWMMSMGGGGREQQVWAG